jgi:hypothetical protein
VFAGPDLPTIEKIAAPAVCRNQPILLVATANGIRLSAPGRALKDGQTGETIPVLNTATRIPLKGVVRDGWIEIFPGRPRPMKRLIFIALVFLTAACTKTIVVQAPPPPETLMMLFSDPRASRVGDLVTVQIVENSAGLERSVPRRTKSPT